MVYPIKNLKSILYLILLFAITILLFTSCSNIKSTKSFEEGKKYFNQKNYNNALKSFKKAVKFNPKNHQAIEAIALCYGDLKDYKTAIKYFEQAVQMKPKNKLYLFNLAITYLKVGEYSKAKEIYQRILYIDRNNKSAKEALDKLREKGY